MDPFEATFKLEEGDFEGTLKENNIKMEILRLEQRIPVNVLMYRSFVSKEVNEEEFKVDQPNEYKYFIEYRNISTFFHCSHKVCLTDRCHPCCMFCLSEELDADHALDQQLASGVTDLKL